MAHRGPHPPFITSQKIFNWYSHRGIEPKAIVPITASSQRRRLKQVDNQRIQRLANQ